jgi:hypothetical protein
MQEVPDSTGNCPKDSMDFVRQISKAMTIPLYTLSNILFANHCRRLIVSLTSSKNEPHINK